MIEKFRKYTGLMFVALVMIVLGLIFFIQDTGLLSGRGGGGPFMKINGRTYSIDDYSMLGDRSLQLANDLRMTLMLGQLAGSPWQPDREKFFVNRMLLRHAQDIYGVHPSDDQVLEYLRTRSVFVNEGEFNQQAYTSYVNRAIGRYGMTESHLYDLVRDYLAYEKIFELVGGGLLANPDFNRRAYADQNQQISLRTIEFQIASYESKIEPTDEEIKTFWEENKEAYTTELRRRFSFVAPAPKTPDSPAAKPAEEKPAADKPATADADAATADGKAAADKPDAAADAKLKAERELAASVDTFLGEVDASEGAEFESLAKEYGWELKTTEWFTKSNLPSDLNRPLREGSSQDKTIAFYLFDDLTVTSDPISKITPAIPVADGGWIIARLDEEEPVRPKTFDEAKTEARADLIQQRAREAMKKDADAAHATLTAALAAGTEFAKAAKDAGLEAKSYTSLNRGTNPPDMIDPRTIFEAAAHTDAGKIADVLHEDNRSVVIFVDKREVVREENLQGRIEAFSSQDTNRNRYIAFDSWLATSREDAKVQRLQ